MMCSFTNIICGMFSVCQLYFLFTEALKKITPALPLSLYMDLFNDLPEAKHGNLSVGLSAPFLLRSSCLITKKSSYPLMSVAMPE